MDFTEQTKKIIRKKAMYKCCFCQNLDIEIHHIKPEKEGGSNDINNGAPICPNCHERFGNDKNKRKRIIEARDNWYEVVEKMYPDNRELNRLERLGTTLDKLQQNQIKLSTFKKELKDFTNEMINNITLGTASSTATGMANATLPREMFYGAAGPTGAYGPTGPYGPSDKSIGSFSGGGAGPSVKSTDRKNKR